MRIFRKRRRAGDDRRSPSASVRHGSVHPLFSDALDRLPHARWAVSCEAEFRTGGDGGGLRGILHHDGAILRFTTWGNTERFAASPMEFEWSRTGDDMFRIVDRGRSVSLSRLAPLSSFVADPPPFAAAEDERLAEALASWMMSWAPSQPGPLASPM